MCLGVCKSLPYEGKEFVVKYSLPDSIDMIIQVSDTVEGYGRKSIQIFIVAKNCAEQVTGGQEIGKRRRIWPTIGIC